LPCFVKKEPARIEERCYLVRCLVTGAFVGGLTGFLGVGGGFVIVPTLVLFAGIPPERAVEPLWLSSPSMLLQVSLDRFKGSRSTGR
jgi:hypothetical protein